MVQMRLESKPEKSNQGPTNWSFIISGIQEGIWEGMKIYNVNMVHFAEILILLSDEKSGIYGVDEKGVTYLI